MSEKNNIDILFKKFIENNLSKKEYEVFMSFFSNPNYRLQIERLMEKHWGEIPQRKKMTEFIDDEDLQKRFEKIEERINKHDFQKRVSEKKLRKENNYKAPRLKIAAAILILLGSFFYFKKGTVNNRQPVEIQKKSNPEAVTLTLDNGNVKVIFAGDKQNITDDQGNVIGVQNGHQLDYGQNLKSDKLTYNELAVPYGNRFELSLSDGTHIVLNAGSSIKYPISFIKGQTRKVFLKGEAYFDVASDTENAFVVNINDINVQVLGTEFNVSYYPEDTEINTVLVEGSVKIYENGTEVNDGNTTLLKPGEKGAWQKADKNVVVEDVDVELYTAWKEGVLLFRKTPFNNIRKKLERHFDITIQNDYKFLDSQMYTATFRGENINEILDAFNQDTPFSYHYDLANNAITLTQNP